MASTYVSLRVHLVFATKGRLPLIAEGVASTPPRLSRWTLRGLGAVPLAVGGVADHVHVLIGIKATHAVSDLVREAKKASTEWVRGEIGLRSFQWQEGYAALSVGEIGAVAAYIENQEAHHRRRSSADELRGVVGGGRNRDRSPVLRVRCDPLRGRGLDRRSGGSATARLASGTPPGSE